MGNDQAGLTEEARVKLALKQKSKKPSNNSLGETQKKMPGQNNGIGL